MSGRRTARAPCVGDRWRPGRVPATLYLAALLLVPIGTLLLYSFYRSVFFGVEHTLTLDSYREVLSDDLYRTLIVRSIVTALLVSLFTIPIAYALAYAITFRIRRSMLVLVLLMAPMFASYVVRVFAWVLILGPTGFVNRGLEGVGVIDEPLRFLLYGRFAVTLTLTTILIPLAMLPIYAALQNVPRDLIHASRDLGESPIRTFARVTLPLTAPAVVASFVFVFLLSGADYLTPQLLGGSSGFLVGRAIADQFGAGGDLPLGGALSFVTLAGTDDRHRRRPRRRPPAGRGAPAARRPGRHREARRPARAPAAPTGPDPRLAPARRGGRPRPVRAARRGRAHVVLELVGAADPVAHVRLVLPRLRGARVHERHRDKPDGRRRVRRGGAGDRRAGGLRARAPVVPAARRSCSGSPAAPLIVPGVVVGVAILTTLGAFGMLPGFGPTVVAHIWLGLPFVLLIMHSRLERFDQRVEEAARDLGSSPARALRTVTLPIIAPTLFATAIIVWVWSMDEFLVSNFIVGTDTTLPVYLFSQLRFGVTPVVNAVATLMLLASIVVLGLAAVVFRLVAARRAEAGGQVESLAGTMAAAHGGAHQA